MKVRTKKILDLLGISEEEMILISNLFAPHDEMSRGERVQMMESRRRQKLDLWTGQPLDVFARN